jgi:hypothetical protein
MKAAIDRIDEGIAVLVGRDDDNVRFSVPVSQLPPGSREGDILTVSFALDGDATAEAKKAISVMVQKLRNNS